MEQIGDVSTNLDANLVRHMVLNSIRACLAKNKQKYGPEVVIACDSKDSWRKDIFRYYKANRKKFRESSGHDWGEIFNVINTIKDELKEYSPYKIIEVDRCEADDIIATLIYEYQETQDNFLIVSSDKDFGQLQKFPNVFQYSPIQKKDIVIDDPNAHLYTLIIKGDSGDGIPNILSEETTLVDGIRQKSITKNFLESAIAKLKDYQEFTDDPIVLRRYIRNSQLIDLSLIPKEYYDNIIKAYSESKAKPKMKFMNYMVKYKLTNLIESLGDF